jgi:hypothetical protein
MKTRLHFTIGILKFTCLKMKFTVNVLSIN